MTESEHVKQELLRQEIKLREAETKSVQLDNIEKELRIHERIQEITRGRTDVHVIETADGPAIVFGNLPDSEVQQLPSPEPDEDGESEDEDGEF